MSQSPEAECRSSRRLPFCFCSQVLSLASPGHCVFSSLSPSLSRSLFFSLSFSCQCLSSAPPFSSSSRCLSLSHSLSLLVFLFARLSQSVCPSLSVSVVSQSVCLSKSVCPSLSISVVSQSVCLSIAPVSPSVSQHSRLLTSHSGK